MDVDQPRQHRTIRQSVRALEIVLFPRKTHAAVCIDKYRDSRFKSPVSINEIGQPARFLIHTIRLTEAGGFSAQIERCGDAFLNYTQCDEPSRHCRGWRRGACGHRPCRDQPHYSAVSPTVEVAYPCCLACRFGLRMCESFQVEDRCNRRRQFDHFQLRQGNSCSAHRSRKDQTRPKRDANQARPRHNTGFGRSIEFWPSLYPGYMRPWTPHPLVAELQGLVRQRGGSIEREP